MSSEEILKDTEERKNSVTSVNEAEVSSVTSYTSGTDYNAPDLEKKKNEVVHLQRSKDADITLEFLNKYSDEIAEPTEAEEKKLSFKVQWIVVTLVGVVNLCLFADKAVFSYSPMLGLWENVKGMNQTTYDNCNSLYYVGYILGQVNLYFLIKYPIRIVFTIVCAAWIIIMFCHCLQYTYKGSYALRLFLGYVESIAMALINKTMAQFLTSTEKAATGSLFMISMTCVSVPVGFIAYGVLKIENPSIYPWRIFVLIIATITALLTLFIFWFYPSNPTDAKFLSIKEKVWVIRRVQRSTHQSNENNVLKKYQVAESLKDPITWLFAAYMFCLMLSNNLGYQANLLYVDVGAVSKLDSTIVSAAVGAFHAANYVLAYYTLKWSKSISWNLILWSAPSFVSCIGMISLPWHKHYAMIVMIGIANFGINYMLCVTWAIQTCSGQTKQMIRIGVVQGLAYSIANIISPQLWRAKDAPRYYPAWIVQLVFSFICCPIIAYVIRVILKRRNEHRLQNLEFNSAKFGYVEKEDGTQTKVDIAALDLTDLENETFIYPL